MLFDCKLYVLKYVFLDLFFQGKMGMPGFPGINGIPVSILMYSSL